MFWIFFSFAALHTGILGGSPKLGWWKDTKNLQRLNLKSSRAERKDGSCSATLFFLIFNNRGILSLPIWYYSAALANFHGLQPISGKGPSYICILYMKYTMLHYCTLHTNEWKPTTNLLRPLAVLNKTHQCSLSSSIVALFCLLLIYLISTSFENYFLLYTGNLILVLLIWIE